MATEKRRKLVIRYANDDSAYEYVPKIGRRIGYEICQGELRIFSDPKRKEDGEGEELARFVAGTWKSLHWYKA